MSHSHFVHKHPYLEDTWVIGWYVRRKTTANLIRGRTAGARCRIKYTRHVNYESAERFAKKWGIEMSKEPYRPRLFARLHEQLGVIIEIE